MQPTKANQSSTGAFYTIKASLKKMSSYLNGKNTSCLYITDIMESLNFLDMGSLILDVGLGDVSNEAMLIGQTVVKHIGRLSVKTPIEE